MYDERLVRAAQEGDEAAFAALYDRAVDSVFDFCWSLTGDADEAARIVDEAFLLAARNLDELSDPSQVRPWLLAIAADRVVADDEDGVLKSGWGAPGQGAGDDEPLGTVALRRWTADAAAVLALADQIVLELQLRQDLETDQLAATIGISAAQLPAMLERVDQEAQTVLGALVLARQGRRDCPELATLLGDWDGSPSARVADLVAAHADVCVRCGRRLNVADALELVAAAPVQTAPAALRNRVLEHAAPELAALTANRKANPPSRPVPAVGPPTEAVGVTRARPRRDVPLVAIVAGAAAVLVLIGAVILLTHKSGGPSSKLTTATTLAPEAPVGPSPTLAPIDTTTTPTTVAPVSALSVNTSRVDFGTALTKQQVVLTDTASVPANWSANVGAKWLTVSPGSGSLTSGQSRTITFVVDRTAAPPGDFTTRVTFIGSDAGATGAAVDVVGTNPSPTTTTSTVPVGGTPTISAVRASPTTVYASPCPLHATTSSVTATVTDPGGSPTVQLLYTQPGSVQTSEPMVSNGGSDWTATLPASSSPGKINYQVTATDGNVTAQPKSGSVTVLACPGVH